MQEKEGNTRSCMQCHFIFDNTEYDGAQDCVLCGSPTLNAYHLYGKSTRKFLKSQQPFKQLVYAEAKQEALRNINSRLKQAVEIKRNIVKYKLNISSHNDALDAAALTKAIKASQTFQEWANRQNQRLAIRAPCNTLANPVSPTGGVIKFTHEDQEKEEPETKKT